MEVEGVVAHAPGHGALLAGGRGLVGLALDTEVHDVVAAYGAVVHHDVPCPQGHRVPLLHLEPGKRERARGLFQVIREFASCINTGLAYLFFSLLPEEEEGISESGSTSM